MSEEPWFLGRVNRQKAEELLNAAGVNGSFVVRSSESISGAYALSVLYNKAVHTYRILPTENQMLAVQTLKGVQQRKFTTLNDMVREYRSPQNGLVCGLSNPVGDNVASPKSAKFDSKSSPSRKEPLPALPPVVNPPMNKPLGNNIGLKVMPSIPSPSLSVPNSTAEKSRDTRNLPPVPSRETSLRAVPQAQSLRLANTTKKDPEFREKLLTRLSEIRAIWPAINSDFFDVVHGYVSDEGLNADIANVRKGGAQCAELQSLLAQEAVAFQSLIYQADEKGAKNFIHKIRFNYDCVAV